MRRSGFLPRRKGFGDHVAVDALGDVAFDQVFIGDALLAEVVEVALVEVGVPVQVEFNYYEEQNQRITIDFQSLVVIEQLRVRGRQRFIDQGQILQ